MSDSSSGRGRSSAKKSPKKNAQRKDLPASEGVLANLPRTRPQRSSARRDAARRSAPEKKEPVPSPASRPRLTAVVKAKPSSAPKQEATPKRATTKTRPAKVKITVKPLQDPAPRQGFEAERDPVSGSVQPPGGVDLFASAAELAGELTKSGLSTGGRLLKDVLARLPLN